MIRSSEDDEPPPGDVFVHDSQKFIHVGHNVFSGSEDYARRLSAWCQRYERGTYATAPCWRSSANFSAADAVESPTPWNLSWAMAT